MTLYVQALTIMTINLVLLSVYFPLVWLNVVFTSDYLPATAVPFYNSASSVGGGLPQYGFVWWLLAFDIFRWIPVFYIFIVLSIPKMLSPTVKLNQKKTQLACGWTALNVILIVIEVFKAVSFAILAIDNVSNFANCFAATPSLDDNCTNYIYILALISSIIFLGFDIFWLAFTGPSINEYILEKVE